MVSTNLPLLSQNIQDDFEGNGTIAQWSALDCIIDPNFSNPEAQGINTSATVLRYNDFGGTWSQVRFETDHPLNIAAHPTFQFKVFIPSSSLSGNQINEVTLRLQNSNTLDPWKNQVSITKPVVLDQWQEVHFNFVTDAFENFDVNAPPPAERVDLNRVIIQVNGEDNQDRVVAYIDDFFHEYNTPLPPPETFDQLIWSDEFDYSGKPDSTKWHHQTLFPVGSSWFSGEIQHYTDRLDNSFVQNGKLHIAARKETYTDQGVTKGYTSARLNSKFAFTYGRVEVRAKIPGGAGTWPAIWMMGRNVDERGAYWQTQGYGSVSWPYCGEIDIAEHWGNEPNDMISAVHNPATYFNTNGWMVHSGGRHVPTALTGFHTYAVEWTAEKIVFSIDSVVHYTYQPSTQHPYNWPFYKPQFLLLNTAIQPAVDPNFSQSVMQIDYVRIYQKSSIGTTEIESQNNLKVFPNPVTDYLYIELPDPSINHAAYEIRDIQGRLMRSGTVSIKNGKGEIQRTEDLAEGIYFLRWNSQVVKFLK